MTDAGSKTYTFESPVKLGDRIWYIHQFASEGPGPALLQPKQYDQAISEITFSADGIRVRIKNTAEVYIGDRLAQPDEKSCLDWITRHAIEDVVLNGWDIDAWKFDADGNSYPIRLRCTMESVRFALCSEHLTTTRPDRDNCFEISPAGKKTGPDERLIVCMTRDGSGKNILTNLPPVRLNSLKKAASMLY